MRGTTRPVILAIESAVWAVAIVAAPCGGAEIPPSDQVAGDLVEFNDNGGWCWFEDERAVVDVAAGRVLISSVANAAGPGGAARHGDLEVTAYDLSSRRLERFTLNGHRQDNEGWADDHNSAALWIRPDGRYVAMYSRHGSDTLSRYRISLNAGDITQWSPERAFDNRASTTYANLHYLAGSQGKGTLYNFTRTANFNPNILVSHDLGETWAYGGRLLTQGTGRQRPYVRYASDGRRVHVVATEQHPRDYENSVYHGYVEGGKLFDSAGRKLDDDLLDAEAIAPSELTPIFVNGTVSGGEIMRRAWTIDVAVDDDGRPYAILQARAGDNDEDHRYFYARFDGKQWETHEAAQAGGYLYQRENDYTGLAALAPGDPNRLFISTKIDPRSKEMLSHYELFEGVTRDGGSTWQWAPITYNSTVDNLRPIALKWGPGRTALLWLRGSYATYTEYNLRVVGLTEIEPITAEGYSN